MATEQEFAQAAQPVSIDNSSKIGVLVIHGFTSTVSSMRYMIQGMADAGFNVEAPRLTGHGTTADELNKAKFGDWINDIENALTRLKLTSNYIFVMGLSLGGGLTLYLAEHHPELSGVIVINNISRFPAYQRLLVPIVKIFTKTMPAIGDDIKDSTQHEIAYDKNPLLALNELFKLTDIINKNLKKISMPILIFKSTIDHVVSQNSATYVYKNVSSADKELVYLENSYHVATQDFDKDKIVSDTVAFIKRIIK